VITLHARAAQKGDAGSAHCRDPKEILHVR
jgi:hypothetical protein